jgi:hypothetical protein
MDHFDDEEVAMALAVPMNSVQPHARAHKRTQLRRAGAGALACSGTHA